MHTFKSLIGVVLTGATMGSQALTIGPVRSPVWLEQRLDIAVPVQLDAGSSSNALCASAEVFFADSPVDRSQVQVTPENTDAPDSVRLRITTTAAVNEPVVTVALQVGCDLKAMRRFVLLPDVPVLSDMAPRRESATAEPAAVPVAPAALTGAAMPEPGGAARTAAGPVALSDAPAVAPRAKSKPRLRLELRAPTARVPAPKPGADGSRLTLAPLQAPAVQAPVAAPAPAVAEPPQMAASEVDRVIQLQGDIQQLLKQAAESDAKLAALRARVEQAESERATLATVLGVGVLVAAIAAVGVPLWLRRRRQPEELNEDPALDPDVKALIVDFNPIDADQWGHPPTKLKS